MTENSDADVILSWHLSQAHRVAVEASLRRLADEPWRDDS